MVTKDVRFCRLQLASGFVKRHVPITWFLHFTGLSSEEAEKSSISAIHRFMPSPRVLTGRASAVYKI